MPNEVRHAQVDGESRCEAPAGRPACSKARSEAESEGWQASLLSHLAGATAAVMPAKKTYYYVYRLRSISSPDQVYTGRTSNLESRIRGHNKKDCPHTAKYVPWMLETCIAFSDEKKAILFERYLKTGSGREFARRHL